MNQGRALCWLSLACGTITHAEKCSKPHQWKANAPGIQLPSSDYIVMDLSNLTHPVILATANARTKHIESFARRCKLYKKTAVQYCFTASKFEKHPSYHTFFPRTAHKGSQGTDNMFFLCLRVLHCYFHTRAHANEGFMSQFRLFELFVFLIWLQRAFGGQPRMLDSGVQLLLRMPPKRISKTKCTPLIR